MNFAKFLRTSFLQNTSGDCFYICNLASSNFSSLPMFLPLFTPFFLIFTLYVEIAFMSSSFRIYPELFIFFFLLTNFLIFLGNKLEIVYVVLSNYIIYVNILHSHPDVSHKLWTSSLHFFTDDFLFLHESYIPSKRYRS